MKKNSIIFLALCCFTTLADQELIKTGCYLMKIKDKRQIIVPHNVYIRSEPGRMILYVTDFNEFCSSNDFFTLNVNGNSFSGSHKTSEYIIDMSGNISSNQHISGYFIKRSLREQYKYKTFRYEYTINPDRSEYAPEFWKNFFMKTDFVLSQKINDLPKRNDIAEVNIDFSIQGKIVDSNNDPLSKTTVDLTINPHKNPSKSGGSDYKRIITDSDGIFKWSGLSGHAIELKIHNSRFITKRIEIHDLEELKKISNQPITVMLKTMEELSKECDTSFNLSFKVVDNNGVPLNGASAFVCVNSHTLKPKRGRTIKLSADGTFELSGFGYCIEITVIKDRWGNNIIIDGRNEIEKWQNKQYVIVYKGREKRNIDKKEQSK